MPGKNVAIYTCSACEYVTDHRSNMNAHIRSHDSATVKKLTLTVDQFLRAHRLLRANGDGQNGDGQNVRPGRPSMKTCAMRTMNEVVDMKDIDARIEYFNKTVRGRSVLDEIRDTSGVVHQFFLFIYHAFGCGALPKFRSAKFVVSRKDRIYFMWKSNDLVMFSDVTKKDLFQFFHTAYEVFERIVIKYPLEHPESSHLLPGEARLVKRDFTCVPYEKLSGRYFSFVDLILGSVEDNATLNALKRFKEHNILMSIRGT
jgi:hypothetical protein